MINKTPISIAFGDGIGPEIMAAVLRILEAANAPITTEIIEVGEKVYLSGNSSGIPNSAWDSLRRTKILLKAPITTPQGGGYKSLNVTIRKSMGLYANVRPCRSLAPFVPTLHPNMDLVIIRENEEDLYAGVEYRQTQDMTIALKIITREGSRKIIQYAFEYARQFNRKKVTCLSKDNIMKITDGLFHQVFNEVAAYYPDIETNHYIVDIGTAKIASQPQLFDVIVTENLYGDIISDVAAEVVGSVGLAGSSNIGSEVAMFEAIHGSAPDIAGKKIANPSGLLNGAIMMLVHIGAYDTATLIENAWLCTLEDGIHTADIYRAGHSQQKVNTDEFAEAVMARLGKQPKQFSAANYHQSSETKTATLELPPAPIQEKELVGVDIYLDLACCGPAELGERIAKLAMPIELKMISNRGVKVWPGGQNETFCSDAWRCRFQKTSGSPALTQQEIIEILTVLMSAGFEVIKTENLYTFDGQLGFSLAQGE